MFTSSNHFMDAASVLCLRPFRDKLENRLYNWKFDTALVHAEHDFHDPACPHAMRPSPREMAVIRQLSHHFANIGWVDGRVSDEIQTHLRELYHERMSNTPASTLNDIPDLVRGYLEAFMFTQAQRAAHDALIKHGHMSLTRQELSLLDQLACFYGDCGPVDHSDLRLLIQKNIDALYSVRKAPPTARL